ncbi:MAG: Uma2 family endonuclease [Acidobacteria bacterium]|nr:Uma2 family endonuclease [Acidobacteriota bacterium]
MAAAIRPLTWDDIKEWPEYHGRTEIVNGELVMSPMPSLHHQDICMRVGTAVLAFVQQHGLGKFYLLPVHVILSERVHYEPDLCFISKERLHILEDPVVKGPHDLIIEVISESNRTHDTVVKFRDYERFGVREYWLVDPREEHIGSYALEAGHYVLLGISGRGDTIHSRLFEGLDLDPASIV